ncbi:hypothetical protein HPG69_005705 [Diceros bicornis minor]|uniref:G-protein coupled receptors family 1 profile domain-containing protein n=1 Tax=Diceros bicornis minor TaxID=77932 RepID=A0A7J7ES92_DICBM|nr:hypothetical protein HPG69_005705 [Diceros bicornis minor]
MSMSNITVFMPSMLTLIGIPGLESVQAQPPGSHVHFLRPAVRDIALSPSIMPKMLGIFWFHMPGIYFDSCLLQMWFIHKFQCMESGILLSMALDHYVAICHPLRHFAIFTYQLITQTSCGSTQGCHSCSLMLIIDKVPVSILSHNRNVQVNKTFGFCRFDLICITLSYIQIFITVFHLPQKEASLYLLVLPFLNPIAYGAKTKQTRVYVGTEDETELSFPGSSDQINLLIFNSSLIRPSVPTLIRIPGLESVRWIGIPSWVSNLLAVIGNSLILVIMTHEKSLHKPMYIFLAMLGATVTALSTCILPKTLDTFWFHLSEISFEACLLQCILFTHSRQLSKVYYWLWL